MVSHSLVRQEGALFTTLPVRPQVHDFAAAMEFKLRENDHKGGWADSAPQWLLRRLRKEVDELEAAVQSGQPALVVLEAADVGNFAMMIADVAGRLEGPAWAPGPLADPQQVVREETRKPDIATMTVRILEDIPPFLDHNEKEQRLKAGDVATVTPTIGATLLRRRKAVAIEVTP